MHEQEQLIETNDSKVPLIARFTSLKERINNSPKKAAIITSAGTLLTLTACGSKQLNDITDCLCGAFALGFMATVGLSTVIIPGKLDEAEYKLMIQNLVGTGSIGLESQDLIKFAERFHNHNVTLALDEIREYRPNLITQVLLGLRHIRD